MPTESTLLLPVREARETAERIERDLRALRCDMPSLPAGMAEQFEEVAHFFADAADRLSRPTLRIASVGTTNAGKSTFLNGALGRTICPTSEDEMSADLLVIEHGDRWALRVTGDEPPPFVDATESRVHTYLKERMRKTVTNRRTRATTSPRPERPPATYQVVAPIFPGHPEHYLRREVNADLAIAVYDLPGLRVRDDAENLEVIKKQVHRALCIVLMDRQSMFDVEKREQLLTELKDSVLAFGNRPSLQIFLLNKTDTRNSDDAPVSDQVAAASQEVTKRLGLAEPAQILGFSGLLYFYGSALNMAVVEGRHADAQVLRAPLLDDCYKGLRAAAALTDRDAGDALRRLLSRTRRLLDEGDEQTAAGPGAPSSLQDLSALAAALLAAAGHHELWDVICARLRGEMSRLLIYPDANVAWRAGGRLLAGSRGYIRTQQVQNQAAVDKAIGQLATFRVSIEADLSAARVVAGNSLRRFLELTRDSDLTDRNAAEIAVALEEIGARPVDQPSLFAAGELLDQLVSHLDVDFLQVLQQQMELHSSVRDIEVAFAKGPGGEHASALADAWDSMKSLGYSQLAARHGRDLELPNPSDDQVNEHKRLQRAVAELFLAARRIMTARAEHFLRTRGTTLATEVDGLTRAWAARVWTESRATSREQTGFDFADDLSISGAHFGHEEVLSLPEDVIKIPEPNIGGSETKPEETWDREDPSASCFKGDWVKHTRLLNVLHVHLPTAATMTRQMSDGLRGEKREFWSRFHGWSESLFKVAFDGLQDQIARYLRVVDEGLAHRKRTLQAAGDARHQEWDAIYARSESIGADLARLATLQGIEDQNASA